MTEARLDHPMPYTEAAVAEPGETLARQKPFPFELRTTELVDF